MATFGSFGAGLASGLEQHRQFQERQQTFQSDQAAKAIERAEARLSDWAESIAKFPGDKDIPQNILAIGESLASGLDKATGTTDYSSIYETVVATPRSVTERVTYREHPSDPNKSIMVHPDGRVEAVDNVLLTGEQLAQSKGHLAGVQETAMQAASPEEPEEMIIVTLLDEQGSPTQARERIRASDWDSTKHTDAVVDDRRPATYIRFTMEEGVGYEQLMRLENDEYVAGGDRKRVTKKPYTYIPLIDQKGWFFRVDPETKEQVKVDLTDVSEKDRKVMLAEAELAAKEATAERTAVIEAEAAVTAEEVTQERRLELKRAKDLFDAETASLLAPIEGKAAAAKARAEFESKVENGDFARMAVIDAMKEVIIHRSKMAAGMGYSEPIRMENGQYMQVSPEGRVSIYGPVTAGKVRYEVTETEGLMKEIQPDGKESLVWMDPKAKALFEAQTKVETEDILAEGRLDRAALEGEIKAAMNVAEWDALEAEVDGLTRRDILRQKGYIKDDAERAMRAAADGYLYYVDTKERVYPDIRKDRKAYSAMVLFNPNAEEGEPRWDAFNRNEDQNVINRQIEAGWVPTSISIASENVEKLMTKSQAAKTETATGYSYEQVGEIGNLFVDLERAGQAGTGIVGKALETTMGLIGMVSPGMEEGLADVFTGMSAEELYSFRERLKRTSLNFIDEYIVDDGRRFTDRELELAQDANGLLALDATPTRIKSTLKNIMKLSLMRAMRNEHALKEYDVGLRWDLRTPEGLNGLGKYLEKKTGLPPTQVEPILIELRQFQLEELRD